MAVAPAAGLGVKYPLSERGGPWNYCPPIDLIAMMDYLLKEQLVFPSAIHGSLHP
jgi:hypothetical protein